MALQARDPSLAEELAAYQSHRDELLQRAASQYVLVHGSDVGGTFPSQMEVVNAGYDRFGNVPVLVKRILAVDTPLGFAIFTCLCDLLVAS
jgi:hypothetical protein